MPLNQAEILLLSHSLSNNSISTQATRHQDIENTREYIAKTWNLLKRSHKDLPEAVKDPKVNHLAYSPWPLYIPTDGNVQDILVTLRKALSEDDIKTIKLQPLPKNYKDIDEHGLLYLPYPYVVPGGRFNEMYGWDSYFIILGLLEDGKVDLAKNMVDNFIFEIKHYGKILNANRSYYLGRSHPPFLTPSVLEVFYVTKDKVWLKSILPTIIKHYKFWTKPPHLIQETSLSRYFALGQGPARVIYNMDFDPLGKNHYERVKEYYQTHNIVDYDRSLYYDAGSALLTSLFYISDRSMRESGFDPSNRFGCFGADTIHYLPVCLNTLLYIMEKDISLMYNILHDNQKAYYWKYLAYKRHVAIDRFLWDEDAGLYLDYNFLIKKRRKYIFACTFYPLWAGLASKEQAKKVVMYLKELEANCGLLTSIYKTGNQWDAPFGWAPLQYIAIKGLKRYGYYDDACRLALKFISLVTNKFKEGGVIAEKYNVEECKINIEGDIKFGYTSNEMGFGWTNGVYLKLLSMFEIY